MATFTNVNALSVLIAIATFALVSSVISKFVPPAKYDGFMYTHPHFDADTILLKAFLDHICPDSRDSWGPLKEAIRYHDNAFGASLALHIVNMLKCDSAFSLLELFFDQQEKFYNILTTNMSRAYVVKAMAKFSTQVVGNSNYNAVKAGFNNRLTDVKTRVSFKYSTSKGVDATLSFFLNGFLLPGAGSSIDFKGWKSFIDLLIRSRNE